MRKAYNEQEVREGFSAASAEAENCFGNGEMYIEKLIENPRHIEFQILADSFGNVVHLGERDCSIQRRNQKLVEEAPAWGLSRDLRRRMGEAAVRAAKAAGYENAGTIEFVVDKDENFYFIEMNTRIQVEHPVTEMITGINIVREQLRIASGLPLGFTQDEIRFEGHAIECRITAEKVFDHFAPCPGRVEFIHFPAGAGIRVDSALYNGCEISPFYDSMVAKIIAKGNTRLEAVRRMRRALEEAVITGVETTLPVQHLLMYNQDFLREMCIRDSIRIVCGINQPESMENSPRISAPMTERDIPRDSGVFNEASFRPSMASSRMMNCQKTGSAKGSWGMIKFRSVGMGRSLSTMSM